MEPPELNSLKSMLKIAKIIALIFGIISLLVFVVEVIIIGVVLATAAAVAGVPAVGAGAVIIGGLYWIVFLIFDFLVWYEIREIERMVAAGQYEPAKGKTLIWAIIGIVLGGLIPGIILLIAYLKFDPVINWQRQAATGGAPPAWGPPAASAPASAPAAAVPAAMNQPPMPSVAPSAPAAPTCPKCGRPATWVAQYSRWYCYTDQQYL